MYESVIIGLDVGTTAVKVAAFEVGGSGGASAMAVKEARMEQPVTGWQVVNPATLLRAVDEAMRLCIQQVNHAHIAGISISTAMHGLIGFDDRMRGVTQLATWADSRAADLARELRGQGHAPMLLERTGTPVHSMSPLLKLMWYQRQEPEEAASVRYWGGIKELVVHHLTGEFVSEISNGSGTGLMNIHDLAWDEVALEFAGVDADQLAPLVSTTEKLSVRPELARAWGIDPATPIVVGAADGPLGNLGTGAIVPGVAGLSLGTSGAVRLAVPGPTYDPQGRLFCYALTEDMWLLGGPSSNGGSAFDWAARTFAPDVVAEDPGQALEIAATAPAGAAGLVMVPYLLAERAPLWDPDIPGCFLGVRQNHRRQHFLRAALEGVCLQLGTVVDVLDEVDHVRAVRATGGPFRAQLWRNVMAAVIGRPFFVASDAGGTALGAAALAAYGLGLADSLGAGLTLMGGTVAGEGDEDAPLVVTGRDASVYANVRESMIELAEDAGRVARAWNVH